MPSRLHTSLSSLTHSLQDFLGLPLPLGPGIAVPVIEFVSSATAKSKNSEISLVASLDMIFPNKRITKALIRQAGLRLCSQTQKTSFLALRLICFF